MSGAISLNGKAVVCFIDGSNLSIYQHLDKNQSLKEIDVGSQQIFNPRNLFNSLQLSSSGNNLNGDTDTLLTCCTLSNDARFLAVADNKKSIFILSCSNTYKWEPLISFRIEKRGIVALKFLEDNESLVMVDKGGEVYLADLNNLKSKYSDVLSPNDLKKILGHCSFITDMILTGNSTHIITCDRDTKIRESLFPHGFVTERYLLGHQKSILGIAAVYFEKFLLSIAIDGECILWSLKNTNISPDNENLLNVNLFTILKLEGSEIGVVENMKVTTFSNKTVFGVKVKSSNFKLIALFNLDFGPRKTFNVGLIQSWKYEMDLAPLDFVLIDDLALMYNSTDKIISKFSIKIIEESLEC